MLSAAAVEKHSTSSDSGGAPAPDEMQEPLGQDGRLAGARAAEDQQRAAGMFDGRSLRRAQGGHLRRIRRR